MEQIVIALITLLGALAAGFFKLIDNQTKVHSRLVDSLDKVAESNIEIAKKTERVAISSERNGRESAERNGHLGEQNIELAKLTKESNKQMLQAIEKIGKQQTVEEQNVIHQTVKG